MNGVQRGTDDLKRFQKRVFLFAPSLYLRHRSPVLS